MIKGDVMKADDAKEIMNYYFKKHEDEINELLRDLQQVSELDGYGACWCEHCDDEICATSQFWSYKQLAEKYNIKYEKYDMKENGEDCDAEDTDTVVLWDNGSNLSYEIAQEIKKQIKEVLKKIKI